VDGSQVIGVARWSARRQGIRFRSDGDAYEMDAGISQTPFSERDIT
jgi:hypothetical protein